MTDTATTFDPRVPGAFLAPDYFATMAELRRGGPLHRIDDDVYLVPRYDDVRAISRDPHAFCSSRGVLVNDPLRFAPADMSGSVLHTDPPDHASRKALVRGGTGPTHLTTTTGKPICQGVGGLNLRGRPSSVSTLTQAQP